MLKRYCESMAAMMESRVATSCSGRSLSSAWMARVTAGTRLSGCRAGARDFWKCTSPVTNWVAVRHERRSDVS